jgi:undecaprenyl-diphosphatase
LRNRDFSALILLCGVGGGELLVFLLKLIYARPRPEPFIAALHVTSASLPSGHAFAALVLSGLSAYFLVGEVRLWRNRLGLIISASLLTTLIGFSRIYLGLHWASDVLAGFAMAALWLTFLITASEIRRRYGGEFPWRSGFEPLHIPSTTRRLILSLAAAASAALIFQTLLQSLRSVP